MSPEQILIPFGYTFIGVLLMMILIPFILRKSDLLTTWNLFLLGSINFVGFAALKAAYESEYFRLLPYVRRDYELYVLGAITFYATVAASYYWIKFPRKLAGRVCRKWPPVSTSVLYSMLVISLVAALVGKLPVYIPGLSQFVAQIGNKGIVIAVALAFAAWFKEKQNPILLGILVGIFVLSALLGVLAGGGRRTLLGVGVTLPICAYWFWLRYKSPATNLAFMGTAAVLGILLLAAYTSIRHFNIRGDMKERNVANSFEALTSLPRLMFSTDVEQLAGQNATQTALAAIHLYTNELPPEPFHALYFVSTNFIPRTFWENKPIGLGYTLPKDARVGGRMTLGPSIVGHGFHEGGLHMLVFYGVLAGMVWRFLDEQLVRQPTNPFMLAMVSAMSGHIIGWSRGDIGTFTIQIIACFIAIQAFAIAGKLLFGVGVVYPRTDGPQFVNQNLFHATLTQADGG